MDDLKLYMLTFNCSRNLIEPEVFAAHVFDGWENPSSSEPSLPDIVVFHLQEIAPIGYAFIGNSFVKSYFRPFETALKRATQRYCKAHKVENVGYFTLAQHNCGLTGLMVFTREDFLGKVHSLNLAEVGVGLAEMGNKGAVGARLGLSTDDSGEILYLTFVSAHLAPFEEEVERRNQDYKEITRGLVFDRENARKGPTGDKSDEAVPLLRDGREESRYTDQSEQTGIYTMDSYLFFGGDLNYRTALTGPTREDNNMFPQPRKDVTDSLHYSHLLEKDQLTQQLEERKTLRGLSEQPIHFPPTYKYKPDPDRPVIRDEDATEWNWSSHRWPSWCDRILFNARHGWNVKAGKYTCLPTFRTSDHRPVALSATVPPRWMASLTFAEQCPVGLDKSHRKRRAIARRKELAVGIAAYLGWTWEGNSLVLGTLVAILGAVWLAGSFS